MFINMVVKRGKKDMIRRWSRSSKRYSRL